MISHKTIKLPPPVHSIACATFEPIILHKADFDPQGHYKGDPRTAAAILYHDRTGVSLGCWGKVTKH